MERIYTILYLYWNRGNCKLGSDDLAEKQNKK